MNTSLFNYNLDQKTIANSPANPRDSSKLLIINRKTKSLTHDHFYNLTKYLTKNDVLVFNNSKVFPARLFGKKATGGKIELLLLSNLKNTTWSAMYRGKVKAKEKLIFGDAAATIISRDSAVVQVKFEIEPKMQMGFIYKFGRTPIPPYIRANSSEKELRKKYQTVYADPTGSVAAPTAGFHFTNALIEKIKKKGVQTEFITLHVGAGTFAPIKSKNLEAHKMHSEYFQVDRNTISRLNKAKKEGKRIISVGTTTTRVLETVASENNLLTTNDACHSTDIFIYPPYRFKFVDALITNFHLPKSTLLALVSAFTSFPNTKDKFEDFENSLIGGAYRKAMENNYRFYSFGDASLII